MEIRPFYLFSFKEFVIIAGFAFGWNFYILVACRVAQAVGSSLSIVSG